MKWAGLILLLMSMTVRAKDDWPVFYDSEKGPEKIFLSREPQPIDFYTNGIPAWNRDLQVPAAKLDSVEIRELGKVGGLKVMEIRGSLKDTYYSDLSMILQEIKEGLFLPVYVRDYNRGTRWPSEMVAIAGKSKLEIDAVMSYFGSGGMRDKYRITISPQRDPRIKTTR